MSEEKRKEQEEYRQFSDPAKWHDDGEGAIRREPIESTQDATFEIIIKGDDWYQTIGNCSDVSYAKYCELVDSLEKAKKDAWDCYQEILQAKEKLADEFPDAQCGISY